MKRVQLSVVGMLIVAMVIAGCSAELETTAPEPPPTRTGTRTPIAATATPTSADPTVRGSTTGIIQVGEINLTVDRPDMQVLDGKSFIAFWVTAYNARGDDYRIRPGYFRLVDTGGVIHEPTTYDSSIDEDVLLPSVGLANRGKVSGWVIFRVPDGTQPREIWYEPTFSFNRAVIRIP